MFELIWISVSLIWRMGQDLTAPSAQLPPNASRGAAWVGLGLGLVMLVGLTVWGIGATVKIWEPQGQYGTINGVHISRADFETCGGKMFEGCPGGMVGMMNKYESIRRRQNQ